MDDLAKPLLIAGVTGYGAWPANTLAGARRCLDAPFDGFEIDVQLPAALFDQPVHGRQPEAGDLAAGLGGEVEVENAGTDIVGDSLAVVADANIGPAAVFGETDFEVPSGSHGLRAVEDDVQQRLLQEIGIDPAEDGPGRRLALHGDVASLLVFLDPPYDAAGEYEIALQILGGGVAGVLAPGAVVIAEHRKKERLEDKYGALGRTRLLEQGDAALSFYAAGPVTSSN